MYINTHTHIYIQTMKERLHMGGERREAKGRKFVGDQGNYFW